MSIDWAATGSMITGFGSFAGALAIVGAAVVGRNVLSDYRKQRLTDKEIEVADLVLTAAYRCEDAVDGMRGRWMPAAELNASEEQLKELGMKLDGMPDKEKSAHIQRGLIYRRAEFFKDDFDSIFDVIPRARAYFGKEIVEFLNAFPRARNRILSSSDMLPIITRDNGRDEDDTHVSIRRDIFGSWNNEPDPIGDMISEAISELEKVLLPIIQSEDDNAK